MGVLGGFGLAGLILAGVLSFGSEKGREYFLYSYLVSFCFLLSVPVGALFYLLIQHVVRAGASTVVRRLAELLASGMLPLAILFLPILIAVLGGSNAPFEWNRLDLIEHDRPLIEMKAPYLNSGFFAVRAVFYFAVWIYLSQRCLNRSLAQDQTGDPEITLQLERMSGGALFLMALTVTFAAIDWLMSLEPRWFSSIFGVYYFAGSMVAFFATLGLLVLRLQAHVPQLKKVTAEHLHDVGKFLFGFICFWAYIAFSQYLLIWYANIPEETVWYKVRQENGWQYVSITLAACHFAIPFLFLMNRQIKRNRSLLALASGFILVIHWLDLYWLAYPKLSPNGPVFGIVDVAVFVGLLGVFGASLVWMTANRPLMVQRDPRLPEGLAFHNL